MLTKDMKADTEYSTCDGALVVPVEPVHGNWFKVYDAEKDEWTLVDGSDQPRAKSDPWGGCHTQKKGQPQRRRTQPGVLVDRYEIDRDGKRIEGTEQRLILRPKDVAGTWKEYLSLYADVVRAKADERAAEELRAQAAEGVLAHYSRHFGVDRDDVSFGYGYRTGDDELLVSVTVRVPVPASRAKNPPAKVVRVAKKLGLLSEVDA